MKMQKNPFFNEDHDALRELAKEFAEKTDLPVLFKPNAGQPISSKDGSTEVAYSMNGSLSVYGPDGLLLFRNNPKGIPVRQTPPASSTSSAPAA